jgi:hypothetical protein
MHARKAGEDDTRALGQTTQVVHPCTNNGRVQKPTATAPQGTPLIKSSTKKKMCFSSSFFLFFLEKTS